jgi:hypothetical protein
MEHTQLFRSVLEVRARELIPRADIVGTEDVYAKLFVPYTDDRKALFEFFEQVNRISTNTLNTRHLLAQQHTD